MADVIPMAIEGMYDKIQTRSKVPKPSQSLRKQIETERILKKEEREEIRRQFHYNLDQKLFSLKTQKLDMVISPPKKSSGFCCEKCTPSSRSALSDEINANSTMNLLNLEKLESHPKGLLSKLFPHIVHAATFKYFSFPYIYNSVLSDNKIQQTIEDSAKELFESESTDNSIYYTMLKKQRERAAKILTTLRSTFSFFILRLASYTMTKVFKRFFSSVIVNPNHIKMLRKADASNLPLIFLPLHRSHIDYIMLTYILCNNDIKSPLVAAGENLRIPVFGWLLRGLGAFFIKRRVIPKKGEDILYKSVLQTYMVHCLGAGYNFEFYIEGGRTRSGKPCMPKSGLLSIIIDAYMEGTIDDALIIPVSINYERLVEGNFVREQMGDPKPIETFGSAISAIWKALISHYGMMRVDFSQPFSLSEMVGTLQKKSSSE
uniref:Phospholipid/glycerol acyltransferase domain-containing protein n=1 Tax=Clastoptera arizonana TaxID=38151 RepID=A0A1B6DEY3_9HEMI